MCARTGLQSCAIDSKYTALGYGRVLLLAGVAVSRRFWVENHGCLQCRDEGRNNLEYMASIAREGVSDRSLYFVSDVAGVHVGQLTGDI